ncbi:MAG: uracil-DNA glycosylase [Candidatus Rifleibacteriota bacterium]
MNVKKFIEMLRKAPTENVFNPWWQIDEVNDDYSNAPEIRRNHLEYYLKERLERKPFLLLGEAMGYQGGHFSGIAMTSERILLGKMKKRGIDPDHVFSVLQPTRTSRENVRKDGFTEPTATIVWSHMLELGIDPHDFVIWNAFPWHPYKPEKGILSNRTPTGEEFEPGLRCVKEFIGIMQPRKIFAVGEKAALQLEKLDLDFHKVRHPANGGATKFKNQISQLL